MLPDLSGCDLALTTTGLIKAVRGDLGEGIALYEEGERRLRDKGDRDLADITATGKAFAMLAAGRKIPEDHLSRVDRRESTDPRFALVRTAIMREASAQ